MTVASGGLFQEEFAVIADRRSPPGSGNYVCINLNYSADRLNFANGTAAKITGTYNVLGAKFAPYVAFPTLATGSLTLPFLGDGTTVQTGSLLLADTWFQPLNLGWHLPRADVWVGYAFMAPTGVYTPGSTTNIGSGHLGQPLQRRRHLLLVPASVRCEPRERPSGQKLRQQGSGNDEIQDDAGPQHKTAEGCGNGRSPNKVTAPRL